MAVIPLEWRAYACMQSKLAATTSIVFGDALEVALNVIHQNGFQPATVSDADFLRRAASAARQERHRRGLRREAQAVARDNGALGAVNDCIEVEGAPPLDDALEVRQELTMIEESLSVEDWELLTGVAQGESYEDLARQRSCSTVALRSRVCRIRQLIVRRRHGRHK